jgi:hypothetical protein
MRDASAANAGTPTRSAVLLAALARAAARFGCFRKIAWWLIPARISAPNGLSFAQRASWRAWMK